MVQALGYTDPPVDRFSAFGVRNDFAQYALDKLKPVEYRDLATEGQPALIAFRYRQSPRYLEALGSTGLLSFADPPPIISGMVEIVLDPQGRLMEFSAVPPQPRRLRHRIDPARTARSQSGKMSALPIPWWLRSL